MIDIDLKLPVASNIELECMSTTHTSKLFELVENNRSHLRVFLNWVDYCDTIEAAEYIVKGEITLLESGKSLPMVILYNDSIVGIAGLHDIDMRNHKASINYLISKELEGKGIVTESIKALIKHSFQTLNLHRLQIYCASEHTKSKAIPISLGFTEEGHLKDAIWHYDTYLDAILYSLINNE